MVADNNVRASRCVTSIAITLSFILLVLLAACSVSPASKASNVPSPTSSPTYTPVSKTPLPTIAVGFGRFRGTVSDARTGEPLKDVCVVIATGGSCQPASPRTDVNGFWSIDLPENIEWDFAWTFDGYVTERKHLRSIAGEQVIDIPLEPTS